MSDDEVIQFASAMTSRLQDPEMVGQLLQNVKQIGTWAIQAGESLGRVSRKFEDTVAKYGNDFPGLSDYHNEWKGYKQRWVKNLWISRDVVAENITILKRFDKVFLELAECIETDQDRKEVIEELGTFVDEKHDRSDEMLQGFLTLKRDIEGFVGNLCAWNKEQGTELKKEAAQLKLDIDAIQAEIEALDKKIKDNTTALTAAGVFLSILGAVEDGTVFAIFKSNRDAKARELQDKIRELEGVNSDQEGLASLQSSFDCLKSDVALVCEKLALFAEIWPAVRNMATRFQEHLKSGNGAETNPRFKKEVRLARVMCDPLEVGLEIYATELSNA
ncbi:hypothetical protein EST38_g13958 [Candolleomyces aberdarensis]|uniref:Uncharacterized protein n=1 Tax=Candolleomyces aberdarensis TaxID=2316362 RepID=A0A4Q2CYJ0_9AGAR|nr:hypothetical protein EST38_g13958 [Candolleomyces aberdarensis]